MIRTAQSGAVLLLCLLLLLALSLLGMAAASDSQLQQRASGNLQQRIPPLFWADAGIQWAEAWLLNLPGDSRPLPCAQSCSGSQPIRPAGHYPADLSDMGIAWWQSNGLPPGHDPVTGSNIAFSGAPPGFDTYWLVEELNHEALPEPVDGIESLSWYRLATAAFSQDTADARVFESIVARPWGDPSFRNALPHDSGSENFCVALAGQPCGRQAWQATR